MSDSNTFNSLLSNFKAAYPQKPFTINKPLVQNRINKLPRLQKLIDPTKQFQRMSNKLEKFK